MAAEAEYRVRTSTSYLVRIGVLAGAAVLAVGGGAWTARALVAEYRYDVIALLVALAVLPVAEWLRTPACRIGGGRHLIRFYPDRIEIPHPRQRKPLVFPHGTHIATATLGRWRTIKLRFGAETRDLSLSCLEDRNDARALLLDLQRFVDGKPAIGRAAHDVHHRTTYDDRLDSELASLD